jgi:hypothetical protein
MNLIGTETQAFEPEILDIFRPMFPGPGASGMLDFPIS